MKWDPFAARHTSKHEGTLLRNTRLRLAAGKEEVFFHASAFPQAVE
jgi:hypothetical protein